MGKGDKKSRKGKIAMGSYGVSRPRKTAKKITATSGSNSKVTVAKKVAAPKKAVAPKKAPAAKPAAAAKKAPAKKAK